MSFNARVPSGVTARSSAAIACRVVPNIAVTTSSLIQIFMFLASLAASVFRFPLRGTTPSQATRRKPRRSFATHGMNALSSRGHRDVREQAALLGNYGPWFDALAREAGLPKAGPPR